jgi:hypothetical protein
MSALRLIMTLLASLLAAGASSAGTVKKSGAASTAHAPATARQAARPQHIELVDATAGAGISFEHLYGGPDKRYIMEMAGSGAAWLDYDVDGRVDLVLVNALPDVTADPPAAAAAYARGESIAPEGAGHRLFRNLGDGRFADVTVGAGIGDLVWGNGAAVADVDNDGFPDLYVTAIGANALYRNNGDGTFSPWPSGAEDPRWGTSAAFTDWDGDGNLDLYVANYLDFDAEVIRPQGEGACMYRGVDVHCGPEGLTGEVDVFYRNNGDGSFAPWPGAKIDTEATFGFALLATDCDSDGRPDIYVASDSTINLLYRHGAGGDIEDWSLFSGAGYSGSGREQAGMGATAADYDGDGDFDLFVTNFQHDYNTLYTNVGDCFFDDDTARLGLAVDSLPYMGWGAQFLDIDGDGDQDIFVANGHVYPQMDAAGLEPWAQRNLLYLNQLAETGAPGFREVGEQAGPGMLVRAASRGVVVADYDNDFDLDLLVTNINDAPTLLQNDGAPPPAALRISLVGRSMNRSAYGARITVESGGRTQSFELRGSDGYLGSNDARLLVALPGGVADRLQITWGRGETTTLEDVAAGWIVLDERRGLVARRSR